MSEERTNHLEPSGSESRKAFEDWCEAEHMPFDISYRFCRGEDGNYDKCGTFDEWEAWQAGIRFIQSDQVDSSAVAD